MYLSVRFFRTFLASSGVANLTNARPWPLLGLSTILMCTGAEPTPSSKSCIRSLSGKPFMPFSDTVQH